jgi:hypothetical protein
MRYNRDMVVAAIHGVGGDALDDIRRTFGLSETELAVLFGVTCASIAKWRLRGVPVERVADVDRVRKLAVHFTRRFIAAHIPQIVRTPGKSLGRKTVLAAITHSGVGPCTPAWSSSSRTPRPSRRRDLPCALSYGARPPGVPGSRA